MPGNAEVLQEFLLKLGFVQDLVSHKKFTDTLSATSKNALNVGKAVVTAVVALEGYVAAFAFQMEKMHYASKLSGSAVKDLRALGYAGEQIGMAEGAMGAYVHHMAEAIRLQPGMTQLIQSFGVETKGRGVDKQALDLLSALKKIVEQTGSETLGAQWAADLLGMSADDFHLYITQTDAFTESLKKAYANQKLMGRDLDQDAATMRDYSNAVRDTSDKLGNLGMAVASRIAPAFLALNNLVKKGLEGITNWYSNWHGNAFTDTIFKSLDKLIFRFQTIAQIVATLMGGEAQASSKLPNVSSGRIKGASPGGNTQQEYLKGLEDQYGLPRGLLDSVWAQESGRGKSMYSSAGAQGHFQFMPSTAKQYGVTDPHDFQQSATGAAKMYRDLLDKYQGNTKKALAAYNWGSGNLDKYLSGEKKFMPKETQDYLASQNFARLGPDRGGPRSLNQTTNINVTGVGADATAKAVAREQSRVNGDMVRNMGGWVAG